MTQPRLPDGFAVQVDRRVRVLGSGAALLGGSPTRLLRLAPAAQTMLDGGRLEVHDAVSAQLARTLLDATVAHPRPARRRRYTYGRGGKLKPTSLEKASCASAARGVSHQT